MRKYLMALIKNAMLITCIYSGLVWGYCCIRIFTGGFGWSEEFYGGIPVTFLDLAMLTFIISGLSGFLFLLAKEAEKL
jgi:hypothetical protein